MKTDAVHFKADTYFRINPLESGLSDQILEFCVFYKLGLSLGYDYIHTPFHSPHSSLPPLPLSIAPPLVNPRPITNIYRKLCRKFYNYWHRLEGKSLPDPYDFLGFNSCLARRNNPLPAMEDLEKIDLELGDITLEKHGITNLEELQNFIRDSIARKIPGKKNFLVTFRASSLSYLLGELIHSNIPHFQDGLNLNKTYFEAKQQHPWKSFFKEDKLKMVMHIRQGDVAVIETPWNTFIPVWLKDLVEYKKFRDIEYDNRVLHLDEYYQFLNKILPRLQGTDCSYLIFSDGFTRAFSQLTLKGVKSLNLTKSRLKKLIKSSKSYDEKAFEPFTTIGSSTLILGEHPRKLCDLLHSILVADIIIIGPRGGMVPKLLATYGHVDTMPIVIVLHKGTPPPFSQIDYMGLHAKAKNFIYVNIVDDDYEGIFSKLTNLVANRHSKQQHS